LLDSRNGLGFTPSLQALPRDLGRLAAHVTRIRPGFTGRRRRAICLRQLSATPALTIWSSKEPETFIAASASGSRRRSLDSAFPAGTSWLGETRWRMPRRSSTKRKFDEGQAEGRGDKTDAREFTANPPWRR
jgi:hypothetical protein